MTEAFLHHLWKFKLFNRHQLSSTNGEEIEILKVGQHNTDAGPDFFNAQIRIGNTTWAGNVEIHQKSSEWNKHQHTNDAAYNNVVLHVVYEHDEEVYTKENIKLITLELKGSFNPEIFQNYLDLIENNRWIPCQEHISKVDDITITTWLERMLIERLESKTGLIADSLKQNKNNWEETFYQQLAKNFGFKTNALPFEMLAKSLPMAVLTKHKTNLFQVEALLFGQSGLLEKDFKDEDPGELKKEYDFLRKKFSLTPMDSSQWKFLRLRPSNFPTIRIEQFAQLIHKSIHLFSKILETETIAELKTYFSVPVSEYWKSHYVFDRPSPVREKTLGEDAAMNILINTVVPFVFAFGRHRNELNFQERAMKFLEELAPEKNAIIANWNQYGITSANAGRTQALLQLKNEYCDKKKCLFCSVGNKIINEPYRNH
ncbi:DUF2851 family protein [soil metagenome]